MKQAKIRNTAINLRDIADQAQFSAEMMDQVRSAMLNPTSRKKELSMHYAKTKMAYDSLLNAVKDGSAPQGLASMASSLTKILGDVADKKVAVRTAKDYQRLEAGIMVALESIPQEYAKEAVAELRRVLEDDNG